MFIHILSEAAREHSNNNNLSNRHSTPQMGLKHTHTSGQMTDMTTTTPKLHRHPAQRHASPNPILATPHPSGKPELRPWATQTRGNQISLIYDKFCDQSITWENRGVNTALLTINKDKIKKKFVQLRYVENFKWLVALLLFDIHNTFSSIICMLNVTSI